MEYNEIKRMSVRDFLLKLEDFMSRTRAQQRAAQKRSKRK